ncbi:MAG: hypothetical protein JW852_05065 [Spirochaetales bacterium]|nr:hypothetical protein [Spirochaetales bacterium]
MKKRILLIILLAAIAVAPAFSFGIGGAFGLNFGGSLGTSGMLSVKFDEYPAVFGLGARFGYDWFNIGITADWWLYETNLVEMLDLYVGPGLYAVLGSGVFDLGLRVPVGIHMFVIDPLELFLELAPAIGIGLSPELRFPQFDIQGAIGFRFWF